MTRDQYVVLAEFLSYLLIGVVGVLCGLVFARWLDR